MSKGSFVKPVPVKLSLLQGIHHTDRSLVLKIPIHTIDRSGMMIITNLPIAYFGEVIGDTFNISSYSYSVQNLPKHLHNIWNIDPDYTAMVGLGTIGVNM